jgi:hypothetical protein
MSATVTAMAKVNPQQLPQGEVFSLVPRTFAEAKELAECIAQSDMVPKDYRGKPANVLVAIQMGLEIHLSPMQALQNIACINCRPALWGDAMLALCQSQPTCEDIIETLDETTMTARCEVRRHGKEPLARTFSQADAKTARLWGKEGPWTSYPKRMLQLRARAFALRDAYAAVLRGLQMAEEMADIPVRNATTGKPAKRPTNVVEHAEPPANDDAPAVEVLDAEPNELDKTVQKIVDAQNQADLDAAVHSDFVKRLAKGSPERLRVVGAYKARQRELADQQEPPWDAVEEQAASARAVNREPGADD